MSNIPGLSVCPVDDVSGSGIEIPSFSENIFIPESHRYGNCRALSEFEKQDTISEGTFGVLYKCRDTRNNNIVALKKFKMPADDFQGISKCVIREINCLNTLKHPNIISSYGTVAARNLETNYLILDYCPISLKDIIDRNIEAIYDKAMVKFLMYQIFQGLDYIHDGLIIHRDISSKNIMFTAQGNLKIGGFCSSRYFSTGNMTPGVTELVYRAPELLFQSREYKPAIDMWSAGCLFAQLLLKKLLFNGTSELEVLRSILYVLGTPSEKIWPGFDDLFANMKESNQPVNIINETPCDQLYQYFTDETEASFYLVKELLIYYPVFRAEAKQCQKMPYFAEMPNAAKPDDLATLIQNILRPASGSNEMEI